jgi:hypothetical protein
VVLQIGKSRGSFLYALVLQTVFCTSVFYRSFLYALVLQAVFCTSVFYRYLSICLCSIGSFFSVLSREAKFVTTFWTTDFTSISNLYLWATIDWQVSDKGHAWATCISQLNIRGLLAPIITSGSYLGKRSKKSRKSIRKIFWLEEKMSENTGCLIYYR